MDTYIALLRKETDSDYGVNFPDFPGCVTAGATLEEASRLAAEALELHIAGALEDGDPIPRPSSLDSVMADPENVDAVAFLVEVKTESPKAVRVNVTFSESVLEQIDAYVESARTTRSKFLADAALERLRKAS